MVECAARRQKWIDQAQSLNIYMAGVSGKKLDETYKLAWLRGLKTTYYLRTMGATSVEKSTLNTGQLNAVPVSGGLGGGAAAASPEVGAAAALTSAVDPIVTSSAVAGSDVKFCSIDNPDCEACQ
jgi:ribonucleoside-diphosphate reductase alpha chain